MLFFEKANKSIELIDQFLNCVDQSLLLFKEGVKNYLYSNGENFSANLQSLEMPSLSRTSCAGKLKTHFFHSH